MKTVFVKREKNDVMFNMEFSAEEFENAQVKAYQANKGQFVIDGFRKGKAPEASSRRSMAKAYSLRMLLTNSSERTIPRL